jgi:transcriptional regulator with XRE-family HTH domain
VSEYAKALGARLRAIRVQQGLSLHGVEEKSQGLWKAVVVGSYERGDRAVTAQRLSELAAFYRVPVSELLPAGATPSITTSPSARVVLALDRLQETTSERGALLARYAAAIQTQRGDYNGRVLSLRDADLQTLSTIYGASLAEVTEQLLECGVLSQGT